MLIVNITDVHFLKSITDPTNSTPKSLTYFSNLYELIETFAIDQKSQATDLWCELTDHSDTICLLVDEVGAYSVWGLAQQQTADTSNNLANTPTAAFPRLANVTLWLAQSLWLIIEDLAGFDRAQSFGVDVLNSSLPIPAGSILQIQTPVNFLRDEYYQNVIKSEIDSIILDFQQIVSNHLGHSCASQVMQDIIASMNDELSMNI